MKTLQPNAKVVAIKYTWALDPSGGYWVAFSNRATEYVGFLDDLKTEDRAGVALVRTRAIVNPGMWQILPEYKSQATFMDAWKEWGLV